MDNQKSIIIGRAPGQCVLIHKGDLETFTAGAKRLNLECVVVDLLISKLSEPITIQQLMNVCPFDEVTSMGEISVLSDLVKEVLPKWRVKEMNEVITQIKKPFNRLEVVIEPLSPKHPLLE